ncbi:MAG: tetratricopeptide repeat protein [Acidobacteria bacterium]|nr:tetratricopeptide repeat protein [Acidobacteriota bacterium]
MGRLLRFIVEAALSKRAEELKEYLLGVEVFDRTAQFDPRTDPIVRVEARRLRAKLRQYYESEGRAEDLIIQVPTGGYTPRFHLRRDMPPMQPQHRKAQPAASIAVLPFSNLSAEPDTDYFSDGLTEEIIYALTKVDGLTVVAWQSAARFKDEHSNLAEIGGRLGVSNILQGSVRRCRQTDHVRVLVKLVETESSRVLWSETYDRMVEGLFSIQEDISRHVAENLRARLLGGEPRQWPLQSYDLYLRGRFHWNKRTPDGFQRAIECFEEAVLRDPRFAPGYAGLADTYSLLAQRGLSAPWDVIPRAKEAALKALSIDGELAEAHTSLALIQSLYEWDWSTAEFHYKRAIAIHPGYVTALHWYGCDYLALLRRFDAARKLMETAARLDPLSAVIISSAGYVSMLERRWDEAMAYQRQALDLDPNFVAAVTGLGRALLHKGDCRRALEMFERGYELAGDMPALLGAMAQAYAVAGDHSTARAILQRIAEISKERFVACTALALAHTGLGETEQALHWLELGAERHEPSICSIAVHPAYDSISQEPRFQALVRRIGLAE